MTSLRQRLFNRETASYLLFGILTTLVNYIVYYGLRHFQINYMIANAAAWVVAVLFAYFTNKHYVFKSHDYSPQVMLPEMARFGAGRLITLLMEQAFMFLTVDVLKGNDRIMKLVVSVAVVILNYVFSKLFIFRNTKENDSKKESSHEN